MGSSKCIHSSAWQWLIERLLCLRGLKQAQILNKGMLPTCDCSFVFLGAALLCWPREADGVSASKLRIFYLVHENVLKFVIAPQRGDQVSKLPFSTFSGCSEMWV